MARPRGTTVALAVWVVVVLAQVAAVGGVYLVSSAPYVTTVNAQVDGEQVQIDAPVDGVLVSWAVGQGSVVSAGQPVGRIRRDGTGFLVGQQVVRSPGRGTVAMTMVEQGQWVTAGTTLALAFESDDIHVTARVPTSAVAAVHVGAPVDLAVDAYPDATVTGVVSEIQPSTAGTLSIYPSPDQNTANPQRITEWVPVRITFTDTDGAAMRPGMNVTARIRRS